MKKETRTKKKVIAFFFFEPQIGRVGRFFCRPIDRLRQCQSRGSAGGGVVGVVVVVVVVH